MRVINDNRVRFAYLVIVLSLALAGDAWRFTLGWWVFGAVSIAGTLFAIVLLIVHRDRWRVGGLPYSLMAFLALATLSILWSFYPAATALGLLTTWMLVVTGVSLAITFSWAELLRGLGAVLRFLIAASLLFELFVSLVLRRPILPLFGQPGVEYESYDKLPPLLFWSRNELFEVFDDGRIQGIVGNANHLGFLALLAVLVFAVQLADRTIRRRWTTIAWLGLAALTLVFTRSATVTVALVGVAIVIGVVLLLRRATTTGARTLIYGVSLGLLGAAVAAVTIFRGALLDLLGRSADLTGRIGIWEKVTELAQQRPGFGWGWVSYWMPWAPPFDDLAFRNGVRMLQAHNTWLDVWFQLGVVGVAAFAVLVISTLLRSWSLAVDREQRRPGAPLPYRALSLLPLGILTALIVQSLAESRLIVEFGILLLALIAAKTKRADPVDTSR